MTFLASRLLLMSVMKRLCRCITFASNICPNFDRNCSLTMGFPETFQRYDNLLGRPTLNEMWHRFWQAPNGGDTVDERVFDRVQNELMQKDPDLDELVAVRRADAEQIRL